MTTTTVPSRAGSRRRNYDRSWYCWTSSSMVRMIVLGGILNLPFSFPRTAAAQEDQTFFTHQCRLCASDHQVPVQPDRVLKMHPDDPPVTCQDVYDHLGTVTDPDDCQALLALVTPFCECDTPRPCSVCSSSSADQKSPRLLNPYDTVTWVDPTTTTSSTTTMTNDTSSSLPCWYFLDIPNVTDPSTDCALLLDLAAPVCQCSSNSPVPTLPLTLAPTMAPVVGNNNNNASSMAPTYSEPCKWQCNNNSNNTTEDDTNAPNRTRLVTIAGTVVACGQLLDWADQNLLSPDVCTAAQLVCGSCSTPPPVASSPNITVTITTASTSPTTAPMTLPPTSRNDALNRETGRDVMVSKAMKTRAAMGTVGWVLLFWLGSSLV